MDPLIHSTTERVPSDLGDYGYEVRPTCVPDSVFDSNDLPDAPCGDHTRSRDRLKSDESRRKPWERQASGRAE